MKRITRSSSARIVVLILMGLCFTATTAQSQVDLPRTSPLASVSQRIGLTDITIDYHRPGVKGREIWNTRLVPYDGTPNLWRAGANENTTITFTHDVSIGGKMLSAGTYGLHARPSEGEWTIIFSNNSTSWGSFSYKEEEDAARVNVTPQKANHEEWMRFGFEELTRTSATAYLHWEELKIPFKIEVDVDAIVLSSIKNELRSVPGFRWRAWNQAAGYCLQNDINLEEALEWSNQSIRREERFNNLQTKSRVLAKLDKKSESEEVMAAAVEVANLAQLRRYAQQLQREDNVDQAIDMFKLNVKRHPKDWSVHNSLAEGYEKKGDVKNAVKNYKKALRMAPDDRKDGVQDKLTALQKTD